MKLSSDAALKIFKDTGALLEGHFILTSGLHSNRYFQCGKVLQYPWHAEKLCKSLVLNFKKEHLDVVVSPALGGILVGQEIARLAKIRSVFTERVEGKMTLRRGFEIAEGERVLVAEDVTTTGGSAQEVADVVKASGGIVVAVTALVDRSGGKVSFGVPYHAIVRLDVTNYDPKDCPMCKEGSQAIKPGSRGVK